MNRLASLSITYVLLSWYENCDDYQMSLQDIFLAYMQQIELVGDMSP